MTKITITAVTVLTINFGALKPADRALTRMKITHRPLSPPWNYTAPVAAGDRELSTYR